MIPVKVKYFEEGSSWTEKRTSSSTAAAAAAAATAKSISKSIIDLSSGPSPILDMESFNDVITASPPSFVFVHNATPAARQQMMQSPHVRKLYGITDLVRYEPREGADKGTVVLIRIGVNCESVENVTKELEGTGGVVRLFMTLQVRAYAGASLTAAALCVDPAATASQRVAAYTSAAPLLGAAELVVLCSNLLAAGKVAELSAAFAAKGFVDAAEEVGEKHNNGNNNNSNSNSGATSQEWTVWLKSSKFAVTHFTHEAAGKGIPPVTTATMGPRSATTIAIPQPRSAKSANMRGSPASTATPVIMTDPAILSAETAGRGGAAAKSSGSVIIERLLQQQQQQQQQQQLQGAPRWWASHAYTMKNNEKLNGSEAAFDISAHFSSVADAVEALNSKAIHWPADFCVVQNVILVSDNVGQGDKRVMFRRYARDYKNSAALLSQMLLPPGSNNNSGGAAVTATTTTTTTTNNNNTQVSSPGIASEKTSWLKRVAALSNHSQNDANGDESSIIPASRALRREEEMRNRTWDISWCTVVYQVTPREMKFNITPVVGLGKENLAEAIQCLNLSSQLKSKTAHVKENPLQNYAYDYALLFSVELQGYWLIAATHVPCDIVACRAAA